MATKKTAVKKAVAKKPASVDLVPTEPKQTAVAAIQGEWSRDQVELVKRTVAVGATDDELKLFMHIVKKAGLDPFARQIHFVKRRDFKTGIEKATFQVGIDGLRAIAERSGQYAGNDDPVFDDEKNPKKATVTVYRMVSGHRVGFTASARWDQYFPGDRVGFMWKKMPHLMLGKCAEALALRKAFPQDMSGLYIHEEMEQAGDTAERKPAEVAEPVQTTLPASEAVPSPSRLFEMAKRAIATLQDPFTAHEWREKVLAKKGTPESKYTDEEVNQLVALCDERIAQLTRKAA